MIPGVGSNWGAIRVQLGWRLRNFLFVYFKKIGFKKKIYKGVILCTIKIYEWFFSEKEPNKFENFWFKLKGPEFKYYRVVISKEPKHRAKMKF